MKPFLSSLLFLSLLLSACVPAATPVTSTPTSVPPSATVKPPTATLTATIELPTATLTATLIPTLTWTPLPTLSAPERHAKVQELLETNNGCKLPCWWGIVPGKTTWSEALHFLTPIIVRMAELGGNKSVHYEIDNVSEQERLMFDVLGNDIVDWISTYQPETHYTYQLHQVLGSLGVPEQIYVSARSHIGKFGAEFPPAILVLDYTHIGVWASYGYLPSRSGENLLICPQDFDKTTPIYELYRTVGGRLELFDPPKGYRWGVPMIEVIGTYVDNTWGPDAIMTLEVATDMTIETFYNTFVDPKSNACLESPLNFWP